MSGPGDKTRARERDSTPTGARSVSRSEGEARDGKWAALRRTLRHAVFHNLLLKLVSLVLALALFFLVNTDRDAIIGVNVDVQYELPEDRVLVSDPVSQVRLSIRGPWRRIKRFDEREIGRVQVDLTNMQNGPYTFPEDAVDLPEDLALLAIDPPTINVAFEPRVQKTVPVKVTTVGAPARGYKVARIAPKPSQVTIRGAESRVATTEAVATRELRLSGRTESFTEVLPLEPPRNQPRSLVEIADRTPIEVEVIVVPEMSTRTFTGVPVTIAAGEGVGASVVERYVTEPAAVDVVLHGPLLTIESIEAKDIVAQVTLHDDDTPGRPQQATVQLATVPEGVGTELKPATVTLRVSR